MKPIATNRLLSLVSLLSFLAIQSCFHPKPKMVIVNPLVAKYITGYTSGMVSKRQHIRIELADAYQQPALGLEIDTVVNLNHGNENAAHAQLPDSTLLNKIFSFEPRIEGHAIWVNSRTIEFIPAEDLSSSQLYTASFKLKKLIDPEEDEFKTFEFQFSAYPQKLTLNNLHLDALDAGSPEWMRLSGELNTSDFEDIAVIDKTIELVVNKRNAKLRWEKSDDNNLYYFYADSIQRLGSAGKIELFLDGACVGSASRDKKMMPVPAIQDFSISSSSIENIDEQTVEVYFSDPLMQHQDLKGIVSLQGCTDPRFAISGNKLSIYHDEVFEGYRKVNITGSIMNFKGFEMGKAYHDSLFFRKHGPEVKIEGNGCILPNSAGLIFPFEAINLNAVDIRVIKIFGNNVQQFLQVNDLNGADGLTRVGKIVVEKKIMLNTDKHKDLSQWNTHIIDLNKLILPDPGSIYRISIKFNKDYTLCDCAPGEDGDNENNTVVAEEYDENWTEDLWQGYGFNSNGFESWDYYSDNENNYCEEDYYYGKAVSRNIIASDIGLIYKLDEKKRAYAFVSNMITTEPMPGCTVAYFDYTRQLIAKGVTNAQGMFEIQLNAKPFLMIASYGRQRGYLKLLDGNVNPLGKFDISGELVQKGVKGYIYGDRGVWRPGDSLYLCFMLGDKEHRLPTNYPVKFEIHNPAGELVYERVKTYNLNGLYDFRTATDPSAGTGNYMATAHVGNRIFRQPLKIETVKPNRLKIAFEPYRSKNTTDSDTSASLTVKWLHGAPAKELAAIVDANLSPVRVTFSKYPGYEFDSPLRFTTTTSYTIFDGNLNEQGTAWLKSGFPVGGTSPAKLRASFTTRVFEAGGDFSVDRSSIDYFPFRNYIGLKSPAGSAIGNKLLSGNNYRFALASVNTNGVAVNLPKVQLKIYKLEWKWWYEHDDEDLVSFIARPGTICVRDTQISTMQGKGYFDFKVNYPEYGRYLVTVTDSEGGHQAGKIIFVDWPGMSRESQGNIENAAMLNFSCNKSSYTTGEDIVLTFPSPAKGKALVSIETGTKVLAKFWVNTRAGETQCSFKATAEMCPNAYIHLSLLQPHANTINDLPIRMYGIIPLTVDNPASHINPLILTADTWKPESTASIEVREEHGRPITYTIAVVDEGLLDLTRFKTPQPWLTFYAREAHGIKTWDMYDAVIGAYAGKLQGLISIGGDGDGLAGRGAKANRFKPMVRFIGPFSLPAGGAATHKIDIPNYVGSVRLMLVGRDAEAFGSTEKTVAVRKPLMVLATLPRVLGPTETVYLPVDVFAMEPHIKDVSVEIEVNELFTIAGEKKQTLHFVKPGDAVLNFKLNVAATTGVARVKAIATCGGQRAEQEIEIEIRNPNPKVVDVAEYTLGAGKQLDQQIILRGLKGTNRVSIEVSSIPSMGFDKRLEELIQYPHGCIEQTTSSVFPQLFVNNLIDVNDKQLAKIDANIKAGLKRLVSFQTAEGGFAYWPGEAYTNEWGSNYAGHFMLEAEKAGYTLPAKMKERWVVYQKQAAQNWSREAGSFTHPHGEESFELIQAYRLFVLALAHEPEAGSMNLMREDKHLHAAAKWRLAAAFQLSGQPAVAIQMVKDLPISVNSYRELSYSYGSQIRDEALILETLTLLRRNWPDGIRKANTVAAHVSASLNANNWMSTQETAYGLLAMSTYAGFEPNKPMQFTALLNGQAQTNHQTTKKIYKLVYNERQLNGNLNLGIRNKSGYPVYVKTLTEGVPLIGDQRAVASHLHMKVNYFDLYGELIHPGKIIQGTDFVAEVMIVNPGSKNMLKEMALNQIFASGWEIHNQRLDDENASQPNRARYQDIRDDRIYTYYEIAPKDTIRFSTRLNATYLGKYYLPTVYSEAMYDNTINARVPGMWVEVIRDPGEMATR